MYKVTLSCGDKTYESEGVDIYSALKEIQPTEFKGVGFFTVDYNGKRSKIGRVKPLQLKRLFARDLDQQILAKRLLTLL